MRGLFYMPCFHSKPAWASTIENENGKRPIQFSGKKTTPDYYIGCGKCDGCAAQKSLEWSIRMFHEGQMHERNCFITLTYENPPEKINRQDPQKFIKRLRHHSDKPIRYFLTGEYGEKTHRPHYHAIIFGEDFLGGAYDINDSLYGNPILSSIWKHGISSIGEFTVASAMYTAGYVNKKLNDKDTFSIMSRYPPLGQTWLQQNKDNVRRLGHVVINGQEMPIPQTYLKWLEGVEEYDHIKEQRTYKQTTKTDKQLNARKLAYKQRAQMREHKI